MTHARLILLGLRGSGKSTLARLVATALGTDCVDLDDLTPRELGCATVREAWDTAGEPGFRRAEVQALGRVLAHAPGVVALGGGTPTAPGAAALLREHATARGVRLVYLHAAPDVLAARLRRADNAHRPALTPGSLDPAGEVQQVYNARDPLYRALADAVVETDGRTPAQVAEELTSLARRA